MNITLQKNEEATNATLTVEVKSDDYSAAVEQKIKEYRKQANINGFRQGQAPASLIKKLYGKAIKIEEIQRLLYKATEEYIKSNNVAMIGQPLLDTDKSSQDFEKDDLQFVFDMALFPEISVEATKKDKIEYLELAVSEEDIEARIEDLRRRTGKYVNPEIADQEEDMFKGTLVQLNKAGNVKEDGLTLADRPLITKYFDDKKQAELFMGKKVGDVVVFSPHKAFKEDARITSLLDIKKEEIADYKGNFQYTITEISRFEKGELNQALFDEAYPNAGITTEEQLKAKIKEAVAATNEKETDYKFLDAIQEYFIKKVGEQKYDDALLKRIIEAADEKREKVVDEEEVANARKDLTWHAVKQQLINRFDIKIEEADVIAAAKEIMTYQFSMYGYMHFPAELLDRYAGEYLQKEENADRAIGLAINNKLVAAVKEAVTLKRKTISKEELYKKAEA